MRKPDIYGNLVFDYKYPDLRTGYKDLVYPKRPDLTDTLTYHTKISADTTRSDTFEKN